jgi:hypothetical protein
MAAREEAKAARRMATMLLLGGVALAGCQGSPVTRMADVPDASNTLGTGGVVWVNPVRGGGATPQGLTDKGTRTFLLDASKGGTFTYGRYTVTFPARAVSANAWVSISIPASAIVECDLAISPAWLNHFSQPVTLTIDCKGTNVTPENVDGLSIYWADGHGWTKVGDDVDPTNLKVSAALAHFSEYRAGW